MLIFNHGSTGNFQIAPTVTRVAIIANPKNPNTALYLRTIQLVLVAIVLNLAFASSINNSFLLLGRGFRFLLLFELAVLAGAYRAWRRPRGTRTGMGLCRTTARDCCCRVNARASSRWLRVWIL